MMNSISASQRRWRRRLRSVTELPSHPLEFERKIQSFLMLNGPLLVAIRQAGVHQAQIETCFLGILDCGTGRWHGRIPLRASGGYGDLPAEGFEPPTYALRMRRSTN
jgi:hypothetical protein